MQQQHGPENEDECVTHDSHCMFEVEIAAHASSETNEAGAADNAGAAAQEMTANQGQNSDEPAVTPEQKMQDGNLEMSTIIITPGAFSGSPNLPEQTFHPDGNREIRSMILAALPMPPMPILACKEIAGEQSFVESELTAVSSHDLIAHLINVSCTVVVAEKNEQRQQIQWKLQENLFSQLDEWQAQHDPGGKKQLLPPPEFGYALLSECTRMYIQSYMPDPTKAQDVRFLPAEDVDRGHAVWKRAMEFQKAQDVLYGSCTFGGFTKHFQEMDYMQLVQHSVRRMLASA